MYGSGAQVTGRITNILNSTGGWASSVILVFATSFSTTATTGTVFNFTNAQTNPGDFSKEYPVVGWTNPDGSVPQGNHVGYGQPYKPLDPSHIAPHTHRALTSSTGNAAAANQRSEPNPTGDTTVNSGLFQVGGVPTVEAFYNNPPNFGVNFIIKAL
jgi:hypothetical protein